MANWEAYRAIKAKAEAIGWPTHYETDLTHHNRIRLSRKDAPDEFLWGLRPMGTHLLDLDNPVEAWRALSVYQMWPDETRWFLWKDEAGMGYLREITWAEVLTRIENALRGYHIYQDLNGPPQDAGEVVGVISDRALVTEDETGQATHWDRDTVDLAVCAFTPRSAINY
jgi:hypothetical protein